ncbi:MAG: hypothetical protein CL925_15030 [Deltaproteobacteria bacterium]|nr:hypothetical protein [Deltaproteobacteria bacterium]
MTHFDFPIVLQIFSTNGFIALNGLKTSRMNIVSRPWICNTEIAEKLGIVEGSPIFKRSRTYYADDERIIAFIDIVPTANATERDLTIKW